MATPTPPFEVAIDQGRTGLLAATPEQWHDALAQLAADPAHRHEMGAAARAAALAAYGPKAQSERLLDVLGSAAPTPARSYRGAPMPHRWRPVPVLLDGYPYPPELRSMQLRPAPGQLPSAALTVGLAEVATVARKGYRTARFFAFRTAAGKRLRRGWKGGRGTRWRG